MRNLKNCLILLPIFLLIAACSDEDTVGAGIEVTTQLDNFSVRTYQRADDWGKRILDCAGWTEDATNSLYRGVSSFNDNVYYSMTIHEVDDNNSNVWQARVKVLDNDSDDIISYSRQKELIADKMCEYLKEPDNKTSGWESFSLED